MEGKNQKTSKSRLLEFNCEDKIALIQCVESRPELWDLSNNKHFNATFIKRSWEEIAWEMDKDDNSCKLAWKSLRDSYKYHKCKQPKRGSAGGDPLEKPTGAAEWDFAPYMGFLPDLSTQRQ